MGGCCGLEQPDQPGDNDPDNFPELDDPTKQVPLDELEIIDRIKQNVTEGVELVVIKEPQEAPPEKSFSTNEEILEALMTLPREAIYTIVNKILNTERRNQKQKGKKDLFNFIKALVALLSKQEQLELRAILARMPSGVLGDEQDRKSSRVLTDIFHDLRQGQVEVQITTDWSTKVLAAFTKTLQQENAHTFLFSVITTTLTPHDKFRAIMAQALLAQILPFAFDKRETFLTFLFPNIVIPEAS